MYHVLLAVTVLVVLGALLLFGSLIGQTPAFASQRIITVLLPGFILLTALFAGLAFIVKELGVLGERISDISREMRKLKK